jgi:anti-sigma factor RsiW
MTTGPNASEESILLVHAYIDGELDAANALATERNLVADPVLAAEGERIKALCKVLRERLPREMPSAAMIARFGKPWRKPRHGPEPGLLHR